MSRSGFLLSILFVIFTVSTAEIKNLKFIDDTRRQILFERFGFSKGGVVNISVTDVSFHSSVGQLDPNHLGFLLISDEDLLRSEYDPQYQNPNPNSNGSGSSSNSYCILSSPHVIKLFTFNDLDAAANSHSQSFPVNHPDEYSLYFVSCAQKVEVSMNVRTAMYNPGPEVWKPDFLSVGQSRLPSLYSTFAVFYLIFCIVWIYMCLVKNRDSVHRIHLLMGLLLVMKGLNLLFFAEDQHYIRTTGTPHGWDVLFYIFQFLKGVLFFTVIVLIGTGWSFLKPFLQDKEKKVLMIVIPLQVLANIASIVIGETGPFIQDWFTWRQVFLIVDVMCCCAIMFPIVWSIRSLKESSKTDGKAARTLAKLTLFRKFYIVVIGYLYFTRIVVFALQTILNYKYKWVSSLSSEAASLAFYVFVFYMFRPTERNQYFVIDEEEEEAAEVALREEEFEL